jgi:chromosomal replication initiation ATPase DnaA
VVAVTPRISIREIQEIVADVHGMTRAVLLADGRRDNINICEARQLAMYVTRQLRPDLPLAVIAREFSKKDHTTVIHAINVTARRLHASPKYWERFEGIMQWCERRGASATHPVPAGGYRIGASPCP